MRINVVLMKKISQIISNRLKMHNHSLPILQRHWMSSKEKIIIKNKIFLLDITQEKALEWIYDPIDIIELIIFYVDDHILG